MLQRIQLLGRGQRIVIFLMLLVGGVMAIIALGLFGYILLQGATPRSVATALRPEVQVTEFATLPDDNAYPAAVTVDEEGTVYTGSYVSGTLWAITPDGTVTEVPGTRETLGSITGLDAAPDGTLYILDRIESNPRSGGGQIWRLPPGGTVEAFATIDDATGFVAPDDIEVDGEGNVYVTDRGRREVWRFTPEGVGQPWWFPVNTEDTSPEAAVVPTGLAYDAANNAMIVTDVQRHTIYRLPITETTPAAEVIYQHPDDQNVPGFDGVTVGQDGQIYVTALDQKGLATIEDGELVYLVGLFRGASDVEVAPDGRLYVTNFDSVALANPLERPQLPFALDVVTIDEADTGA